MQNAFRISVREGILLQKKSVKIWKQLTTYIDRIYVANIIGGEPFLNPELKEIVRICAENPKIETLELTTNATIVPDDGVIRAIKDGGVTVHISNYPNLDQRYIENKRRLIEKLKEYGVPYEYQFHEIWLDFGEIENTITRVRN